MIPIYLPLEFSFAYPCYLSLSQRQEAILKKSLSLMRNIAWVIFYKVLNLKKVSFDITVIMYQAD